MSPLNLVGQNNGWVYAHIQNELCKPVPYASISISGSYGTIADSLGNFKIYSSSGNKIKISSIGYEEMLVTYDAIVQKPIIVLETKTINLNLVEVKPKKYTLVQVGYSKKERLRKMEYLINSNFEDAILIKNSNNIEAKILYINIKAGFKGSPILPLRLNIYDINSENLPSKNLLKNDIILTPSNDMKWYKIDVSNQNIYFPSNGICVSVEFLNNSIKHYKLSKNLTPIIGVFKSNFYKRILRTDILYKWVSFGITPPAIFLEMEQYD